jgi:hypothetical protein
MLKRFHEIEIPILHGKDIVITSEKKICDKDSFKDTKYRKFIKKVLLEKEDAINYINDHYLNDDSYWSSIYNVTITLLQLEAEGKLGDELKKDKHEFVAESHMLLSQKIIQDPNNLFEYINNYFEIDSRDRWGRPNFPICPSVPRLLKFKEFYDHKMTQIKVDFFKLKYTLRLKRLFESWLQVVDAMIKETDQYGYDLTLYHGNLEYAKARMEPLYEFLILHYNSLVQIPTSKLKTSVRGSLPFWNDNEETLNNLFESLCERNYLKDKVEYNKFKILFTGLKLESLNETIHWMDVAKSKKPNQRSLITLFHILAIEGFIDPEFLEGRNLIPFLKHSFLRADGTQPKNLSTTYSELSTTSSSYKEMRDIVLSSKKD